MSDHRIDIPIFFSTKRSKLDNVTVSTLEEFKIVAIPGWVMRTLKRANVTLADLSSYQKVREFLSLSDLAEWFYVNDAYDIGDRRLSSGPIEWSWNDTMGSSNSTGAGSYNSVPVDKASQNREVNKEIRASIIPMSISEEVKHSVKAKFSGSNPMNDCLYQFVPFQNTLYVVLNEGFGSILHNPDELREFVKKYLKQCYAMAPVAKVSQTVALFDVYLRDLRNN